MKSSGMTVRMRKLAAVLVMLAVIAVSVSAATLVLTNVITFVCTLVKTFKTLGASLGVLMFVFGAAKYVYTADDPGGRKQGLAICVAAIIGIIFLLSADGIINGLGSVMGAGAPAGCS